MNNQRKKYQITFASPLRYQSGVAFLLIILVLILTTTTLIVGNISRNEVSLSKTHKTQKNLHLARDALLGFSLNQSVPGTLPCPDVNGDGDADMSSGTCSAISAWLPYRTLGLDNLRDSSGEKIWYAVDPNFTSAAAPFNSSSPTNIQLDGIASAFLLLAPNTTINNQIRNSGNLNRANYFEGVNADNNPYTYEQQNSMGNDILLAQSNQAFWQLIEDVIIVPVGTNALQNYYSACGSFPWASAFLSEPKQSSVNLQHGNLPIDTAIDSNGTGCTTQLNFPTWFEQHWRDNIYYQFCLNSQNQCLQINGDIMTTANAAIIASGVALDTQNRPSTQYTNYLENVNATNSNQLIFLEPNNHSEIFNDVLHYIP